MRSAAFRPAAWEAEHVEVLTGERLEVHDLDAGAVQHRSQVARHQAHFLVDVVRAGRLQFGEAVAHGEAGSEHEETFAVLDVAPDGWCVQR